MSTRFLLVLFVVLGLANWLADGRSLAERSVITVAVAVAVVGCYKLIEAAFKTL